MSKNKPSKRELEDRILALEMKLTLTIDRLNRIEREPIKLIGTNVRPDIFDSNDLEWPMPPRFPGLEHGYRLQTSDAAGCTPGEQ